MLTYLCATKQVNQLSFHVKRLTIVNMWIKLWVSQFHVELRPAIRGN